MFIAILGRQPELGIAELERKYSDVRCFSDQSALIKTDSINIEQLGGSLKIGRVAAELAHADWRQASMQLVKAYSSAWATFDGKITLGISAYGFDVGPREVQKTGIILKGKLKTTGVSLRLIPNADAALNTATSHHNKLGLSNNKVELLIVRSKNGNVVIAESTGAQNITSLSSRDQERPKRDAFVGMLPPKLAQVMINLAGPLTPTGSEPQPWILDPFCGTGVILQEAALMHHAVYGTDLSEKMIRYSRDNLNWLLDKFSMTTGWYLHEGDAMTTTWRQPINAVICESYLGQPFSAPPSPSKLTEVRGNCDHIISSFLKNIAPQLSSGTPLCIAVPAWRAADGSFTHLPLTNKLDQFGFQRVTLKNVDTKKLLYYREDQVVARELLVLTKQ